MKYGVSLQCWKGVWGMYRVVENVYSLGVWGRYFTIQECGVLENVYSLYGVCIFKVYWVLCRYVYTLWGWYVYGLID